MIRAVIADDQPLVRAGLRSIFDHADDITVVADASDGRAAVQTVRELHPDVILMDIRMPIMDGIEATRLITGDPQLAGVRVLILTLILMSMCTRHFRPAPAAFCSRMRRRSGCSTRSESSLTETHFLLRPPLDD